MAHEFWEDFSRPKTLVAKGPPIAPVYYYYTSDTATTSASSSTAGYYTVSTSSACTATIGAGCIIYYRR